MKGSTIAVGAVMGSVLVIAPFRPSPVSAAVPGLVNTTVLESIGGEPVAARFAPDGRIYVAMKGGQVRMYDGAGDATPVQTLDIATEVHDYWDRGLLGIALDPAFDAGRPYLYVLYAFDRDPFGSALMPRWGDGCPSPPGGTTDGCTISARLARYSIGPDGVAVPGSRVLLLDGVDAGGTQHGGWCMQFPSHSIGSLAFAADGSLLVGAGDGANFNAVDYGQEGGSTQTPFNPCNDRQGPAGGPMSGSRGTALDPGQSHGGALRSQAVRRATPGSYVTWDGAILRIDPNTGAAKPDNPLVGNGIEGDDRIVAYGLRNPFRYTVRPGTSEVWVGDVQWGNWEEIDVFTLGASSVPNFGWPCYEGVGRQGAYDGQNIGLCETLYGSNTSTLPGGVTSPLVQPRYAWSRGWDNTGPLPCSVDNGGGSVTGGQFAANPDWPASVRGAYVFADYSRGCIMAIPLDAGGNPNPGTKGSNVVQLLADVQAVDIQVGPNGDIYWIDIGAGTLNRLRANVGNLPPEAAFTATPASGAVPLQVQFDASGTSDPTPAEVLTYTWDLDGDGSCDDASGITTSRTYGSKTVVNVKLCVSDQLGEDDTATRTIRPGYLAPVIQTLTTSADGGGWAVGDTVTFAGSATDADGGLAASAYTWSMRLRHCDDEASATCHAHLQPAPSSGPTGSIVMPDHEFYAYMELTLTVTDADGLTATRTVDIRPRLSTVTVQTEPPGLPVTLAAQGGAAPLTERFLEGGVVAMSAAETASVGGHHYVFDGWTDAPTGPASRTMPAPPGGATVVARYELVDVLPPAASGAVVPIAPTRLLDTRNGIGAPTARLPAGGSVHVQVAGTPAVPGGATSAAVNITAVNASGAGFVTAHPCGTVVPTVSNVNVRAGETVANLATVPLGGDGGICVYTSVETDLLVDLNGVVVDGDVPAAGEGYTGITPVRVIDSRLGLGAAHRRVEQGETVTVPLDAAGVPNDATAVVVNLTVDDPDAAGYLTSYPCGGSVPESSNLNYRSGQTVANAALTALGTGGQLCIFASASLDLIVDVSGWLSPVGAAFTPVQPIRVLDTRAGQPLGAEQAIALPIAGLGAPPGAVAMVANVTAVGPAGGGYLTVYPCSSPLPTASNVNYVTGQDRAGLAVTAVGSGAVCVFSYAATDLLVDVQGWLVT